MANYPKELEDLLQDCLTDGIITPQERQVLLKKAESMGVDPAEYDLHITNEEQKLEQANRAAAAKVKGRSCPYCGSNIPQLADKCPSCNKSISVQADSELEEIIDHLEEALVEFKSGKDFDKSKANVERYIRKAEMYYGSNPKIQILLEQVRKESDIAESKAKKKALWKIIGKILTYNKWLTAGVILALIMGIGALVTSITDAVRGGDPTYKAEACVREINKAIDNGDLGKAEALLSGYSGRNRSDVMETGKAALSKAYLDKNELEKALQFDPKGFTSPRVASELRFEIQDKYIQQGEYEKAEKVLDYGSYTSDYYDFLCKVIDHMKENGKKSSIKSFIERKVPSFYNKSWNHDKEWQANSVQARLYKYAGL